MPDERVRLRCPECGIVYDVPATWARKKADSNGLGCSACLLEKARLVPLVKSNEDREERP